MKLRAAAKSQCWKRNRQARLDKGSASHACERQNLAAAKLSLRTGAQGEQEFCPGQTKHKH
eukprot:6853443-Pyramimonas_sp.AAC.1